MSWGDIFEGFRVVKADTSHEPYRNPNPPKPCLGYRDDWTLEYDCEYEPDIICEDCICSGLGNIDPETGEEYVK